VWLYVNYIFKDPISKSGHTLRLQVDMDFGRTLMNPGQAKSMLGTHRPHQS
jgi:hypothetical protein